MDCEDVKTAIKLMESEGSDEELLKEVRKHINGCASCRKPWEDLAAAGEWPVIICPLKEGG